MRFLATFLCVSLFCPCALSASPRPPTFPEPVFPPASPIPPAPAPPQGLPPRAAYAFGVLEIIFPDFRLQYPASLSGGVNSLVISWPVHLVGANTDTYPECFGGSLFLEPALPTNRTAFRGLAGLRGFATYEAIGVAVEGGGVLASDGSGAFAGAGPAVGDGTAVLALVGRRYFVDGEDRWDFTLDFSMTAVTLWEILQRGKYIEE